MDAHKLLVFEVDDKGNAITAPRPVPSAEELGRVTLEASGVHFAKYGLSAVDQPNRKRFIGQAILDALKERP